MTSLVESYYGLSKPPFTTSDSSGPVFMTEPLRAAARFLRDGLAADAEILCISGPSGIGKSSLARALPKLCGSGYQIAVLSGRAGCWEDLRRVLLREFGIAKDRITRDGIEEARARLGKLLIVVDDAQYLSPELLERICVLPQLRTPEGDPVAQVVMLADLDAVDRDRMRPLLAWLEEYGHHAMTMLEGSEVHAYLDSRMRRVGWQGHPLINEPGALALHRLSLGNPRRLSELGGQLLEYAASRGITLIDAEFVVATFGDEKRRDTEEALAAAPGTELCDGDVLELDADWETELAASPLTAENISLAPSLELAEPLAPEPEPLPSSLAGLVESPPLESIRAVYKEPEQPTQLSRYRQPKGGSHRTLALLLAIAAIAVLFYATHGDLGTLLAGIDMPFSFAAERIEEIDRVGETNAAQVVEEADLSSVLYDELGAITPAPPTEPRLDAAPSAPAETPRGIVLASAAEGPAPTR